MRKGFTLIELLIVIGIIAILAVAVILVLNPTQLLKEGRDSTRMSDMSTLNSAIALYLADQTPGSWTQVANCARSSITGGVGVPKTNTATSTCTASSSQVVTGAGWIPIDFSSVTGGTVINKLPIDPVNDNTSCTVSSDVSGSLTHCVYIYRSSTTVGRYLLETNMESTKYSSGGPKDVESTDGGVISQWYEVGSNLATSTF